MDSLEEFFLIYVAALFSEGESIYIYTQPACSCSCKNVVAQAIRYSIIRNNIQCLTCKVK